MARAWNNGEGGSNGTTVTPANSGGASGTAFDVVSIGTSCALTFDTTQRRGALAYKLVTTGATTGSVFVEWSTLGTLTTAWVRLYLYMTALPSGGALRLIRFLNGVTEAGVVTIAAAGQLQLRDSVGAIAGNMTSVIGINQWIRIEASIVCNATTGSIEVELFNSSDAILPTETLTKTARNTLTQITKIDVGETNVPGSVGARTYWLDDLAVDTVGYPGPSQVSGSVIGPSSPKGVGIVVAGGLRQALGAAALTAVSAIAAAGRGLLSGAAALIGIGNMTASGARAGSGAATFVGVARTTANPSSIRPPAPPVGGWGTGEWDGMPWGGAELPFAVPPLIGRDGFPPELPPLEHAIVGPNGLADYPEVVSGFGADEEAGFATLAGYVERDRVADLPLIYTDGAQWVVTDSATGLIVAAGDLLTPAIGQGMAGLKADGWAKRLGRRGERLMYAIAGDYSAQFVPKNSEPYGPTGKGFYVHGEERFTLSTEGALRWTMSKGSGVYADGDQHGFVASFEGLRPGVRRITGSLHATRTGEKFLLRAATAASPSGGLSGYVTIANLLTTADLDFDVTLPIAAPILDIDVMCSGGDTISNDYAVTITNLVVYGIATDDRWSASDVGRDVAGRLGFATAIEESTFDVLPLDAGADGVYQDALDAVALLSGMFYRVLGAPPGVPLLEMRRQGSVRWEVVDPEFPVEPIPLPRYDSVLVPYVLSNGVATSVLEVTADAIGLPMLPVSRSYGPLPLRTPVPDATKATVLGQQVLTLVYPPRFGGTCSFSRVFSPQAGFATAHEVHSCDVLVLPLSGGLALPIKSLHREGGVVSATFDDGIASADRLLARKNRTLIRS